MQILQELRGHPWDGDSQKIVHSFADDAPIRVVKRTDVMTLEFIHGRITVIVDEQGTISDVQQELGL